MIVFLLVIFGIILALAIDKEPEDVLPAFVATILVAFYSLAILGYAHHSFHFTIIVFVAIYGFFIYKNRRLVPSISMLKEKIINANHLGLLAYIIMVLIMVWCYSTHFVNVWDDFHYNATFPRNMYYFGTMPYGYQSTTGYKDYFPTQQLFFYWAFQGIKGFSEPLMFQCKLFLVYTFMLPIFKQVNYGTVAKRVMACAVACVMPFMCLFEILESLSMDTVLALLFANVLNAVIEKSKNELSPSKTEERYNWCGYYRILIFLCALVLYKSYALVFACISMGVWLFNEFIGIKQITKKERVIRFISYVGICGVTFVAYLSWRIFCNRHGNTTYLSDIMSDNMSGESGFTLPSYGIDTIKNILRSLWCMRLNFGNLSLTVLSGVLIYIAVSIIAKIYKEYTIKDLWTDVIVLAGFAGFILFLMYTYLFVFEDWEAYELSSLDRYMGTYVLVLVFLTAKKLFSLYKDVALEATDTKSDENLVDGYGKINILPMATFTIICIISLNYGFLKNALIPSKYVSSRQELYDTRMIVEGEVGALSQHSLGNATVILVSDRMDDLYMRSMQYAFIPLHAYQFDISDDENDSAAFDAILDERVPDYVYIVKDIDISLVNKQFAGYIDENEDIKPGSFYVYDRETKKLNIKQ